MFGTLFKIECKQILKSLVYYIYVVIFILFMTSQMSDSEWMEGIQKPEPGQASYGRVYTKDETVIMENTLASLVKNLEENSFNTYPLGFVKHVTLSETELAQAKQIVESCTGKGWEETISEMENHFASFDLTTIEGSMAAYGSYEITVREGLTYKEFEEQMLEICRFLGKGSDYEKVKYENTATVPMTYEQAVEEYEEMCNTDKITGTYMRIFCDYAGIVLAVLPIFIGVSRALRDKRAKAEQVIYAKSISGARIMVSRYLANVVMVFLPVLVTAFLIQQPYLYKAQTIGVTPDALAFLKYTVVWLLPEIMIVLAAAFLITEYTGNILSIFVQVGWAVASLFGAVTLTGNFGFKLVARWNTIGESVRFLTEKNQLLLNRGYYLLLAVVCITLTVFVYERKRKGGETLYGKIFKSNR